MSQLEDRFGTTCDYQFEPRYTIAPRNDNEVVPNDAPETARRMNWGVRPRWVDDPRGPDHEGDAAVGVLLRDIGISLS